MPCNEAGGDEKMKKDTRKKVILFLVEGFSDKNSLGLILSRLIDDREVRFHIVQGDVTAAYNTIPLINRQIKSFLSRTHFKKSDILRIVQLIDTDGAFIDPSRVRYSNIKKLEYFDDHVKTPTPEAIIRRNELKSESARRLSEENYIFGIPYSIYYFSVNIEHVLHGVRGGLDSCEKVRFSHEFVERFAERPQDFIELMRSDAVAAPGGYKDSWAYIFEDSHSLLRNSNFRLFFE